MYTYYKETQSEEHMLYATEIAELAGIYSLKNKPATALVSEILQDHIKSLDNYEQYYYLSGPYNRKNKVYPKSIYVQAIIDFFIGINCEYGNNIPEKLTTEFNNKKYKFTIIQEENNINK